MIVSSIVAMGENRVIGKNNKMMWRLPLEWDYFKKTTMGHCIITGRKNIEAQGRALPGRTNIVVTRNKDFAMKDCLIAHSIDEALNLCRKQGESEAFICGGGQIYAETMGIVDKLYLTVVDFSEEGDVYFPKFDESKFEKILVREEAASEHNKYAWKAYLYTRK